MIDWQLVFTCMGLWGWSMWFLSCIVDREERENQRIILSMVALVIWIIGVLGGMFV